MKSARFDKIRTMPTLIAIIAVACLSFGCAHHQVVKEFSPDRIRPLSEFRTFTEPSDLIDNVAYLAPGDAIPVKLRFESDWLGIRQDEVELVAKRKIFLRVGLPEDISRERVEKLRNLDAQKLREMSEPEKAALFEGVMLYLSKDGIRWAPLNDRGAIKEVFDIESGVLTAGMGMNASEGLWADLSMEMFRK